ncbi:MAG TPA: hypothetical protein ENK67_06100 [Flavobacteriia bacterium]|nr:hypothetical protein [Flavobacteriia bacterium]
MKNNIKFIVGGLLLLVLFFSFRNFQSKNKVQKESRLLAMNMDNNLIPNYQIPKIEKKDVIEYKINKTTTDADFLKIMEELKKKDIDVLFNNVERNEDTIITNIEIIVSKGDLSDQFSDTNPNGIEPILILITNDRIHIGYEYTQDDGVFAFSNGNTQSQISQIQKMMQRQMQLFQQLQGSSNNNNDIFAKFFGNDVMMSDPDKMMQQMMQQMMQSNDAFFSNQQRGNKNQAKEEASVKIEKHYIVNGKEMSEEAYRKMDKSKIRSLQVYQTQVVSKQYGM